MVFKGRSRDPYISEKIQEAILCRAWGCRPSQLGDELSDDVEIHTQIYNRMMKENPFM